MSASQLIQTYYQCFNRRDYPGMLALLSPQVLHEVSQGESQHGQEAFARFLAHMDACYRERVYDLVILSNPEGSRVAAEFMLDGEYRQTDGALPPAQGQTYPIRVGAFFELKDGFITRVSNHYNLRDWIAQVS